VHPSLAKILIKWRDEGWREMMGRAPTPDDLVVPCPAREKFAAGRMSDKNYSRKRLMEDLTVFGLRHRRGHDLRRTMISLARRDGARKDILEL
jgi:integrase